MSTEEFINTELESILISTLLNNNTFCDNNLLKINSNFFHHNNHRALYSVIYDHFMNYHGLITEEILINVMKENGAEESKVEEYLLLYNRLKEKKALDNEAAFAIDRLRDLYLKRASYDLLSEGIDNLKLKSGEDLVNNMEEKLLNIKESGNISEVTESFIYEDTDIKKQEYLTLINNPDSLKGVPYGIKEIDEHTSGLHKSEFGLIVAGPKCGKSRLLFNIGANAAEKGYSVMFITLEMPKVQVERMYHSRKGQLSYNKIKFGRLTPEEQAIYFDLLTNPPKENFYIVDIPIGCNPTIIRHKINQFKKLHHIDIVIVDYISLVEGNKKYTAGWEKETDVAKQFKQIARAERIAILSAAQLTKEARKGNKVGMEWIALGDLAPHCDIIFQLLKQTEEEKTIGILNGQIVAFRDGGPLSFSMSVNWDLNFVGNKQLLLDSIEQNNSTGGVINVSNNPTNEQPDRPNGENSQNQTP